VPYLAAYKALLPGDEIGWRSRTANDYRATDDVSAIFAWMEGVAQSCLPATAKALIGDVEKFALWSVGICRKPLSSMKNGDFEEFFQFLAAPNREWIESSPYLRSDPAWRPFRKSLGVSSCRRVLSSLRRLYLDWYRSGYLTCNPIAQFRIAPTPATYHWMTRRDWSLVWSTLEKLPMNPETRRLRASLCLIRLCTMTLNEASRICFEHLKEEATPQGVRLVGKFDSVRVLIDEPTRGAVEAHYQDRLHLMGDGPLSTILGVPKLKLSLLGPLSHVAFREVSRRTPRTPSHLASRSNPTARVHPKTLRISIMRFMEGIANSSDMIEDGDGFLSRADRWLRSPKRQTEARRRQVLVQKMLGNHVDDILDTPENEQKEMWDLANGRVQPL